MMLIELFALLLFGTEAMSYRGLVDFSPTTFAEVCMVDSRVFGVTRYELISQKLLAQAEELIALDDDILHTVDSPSGLVERPRLFLIGGDDRSYFFIEGMRLWIWDRKGRSWSTQDLIFPQNIAHVWSSGERLVLGSGMVVRTESSIPCYKAYFARYDRSWNLIDCALEGKDFKESFLAKDFPRPFFNANGRGGLFYTRTGDTFDFVEGSNSTLSPERLSGMPDTRQGVVKVCGLEQGFSLLIIGIDRTSAHLYEKGAWTEIGIWQGSFSDAIVLDHMTVLLAKDGRCISQPWQRPPH